MTWSPPGNCQRYHHNLGNEPENSAWPSGTSSSSPCWPMSVVSSMSTVGDGASEDLGWRRSVQNQRWESHCPGHPVMIAVSVPWQNTSRSLVCCLSFKKHCGSSYHRPLWWHGMNWSRCWKPRCSHPTQASGCAYGCAYILVKRCPRRSRSKAGITICCSCKMLFIILHMADAMVTASWACCPVHQQ